MTLLRNSMMITFKKVNEDNNMHQDDIIFKSFSKSCRS